MDDELFKGALGLDSDEDDVGLPAEQTEEPDQATQRLQEAGLDSDDEDNGPQAMQHDDDPEIKDELPQTPPAPGFPADDPGGLKGTGLEDSDEDMKQDIKDDPDATQEAKTNTLPVKKERKTRPPETWEVALVPRPDESLHVITFKSMVDIESRPYTEDEFTLDEKISFDEHGNRIHRAPPLNRIRYRFDYEHTGTDLKMESNARIVKWSDGTMSLMIGSECVDLKDEPISGQRLLLGVKQAATDTIQAQQLLTKRFVIRPPSLESKLHTNMTTALSPEKQPRSSIKANPILEDFAHEHMANLERDNEQRKIREKQNKAMRRKTAGGEPPRRFVNHRLTAAYLEADDDEDDDEYNDARGRRHSAAAEAQAEKRLLQTKAGKRGGAVLGDDDDDGVVLSDDDDEEPVHRPKRQALLDSDDEF